MSKKLSLIEMEDLAFFLIGKEEEDEDDIQLLFFEKFDIDFNDFWDVMNILWPAIGIGISPINEVCHIGITKPGEWVIKRPYNAEFISSIVEWFSVSDLKKGKGFKRDITNGGILEYEVSIKKM